MLSAEILALVPRVLEIRRSRGEKLATAESCTGGLIVAALTAVAGSSDVVDRGFVTYSNEAKAEMLGVPTSLIATHGAVSGEVAAAMAAGALDHSMADIAVSVTGIAGPGGGSLEKPVGLVWFGLSRRHHAPTIHRHILPGNRAAIRAAAVQIALLLFLTPDS